MYRQTLQNSLTLSGPKVTRPGPLGLGCTPSTPSLVVGSLHKRSMSTTPPSSIVSGRCRLSICSILEMDRPMPACHVLRFVYCALYMCMVSRSRQSQKQAPCFTCRLAHSTDIHSKQCLKRDTCRAVGGIAMQLWPAMCGWYECCSKTVTSGLIASQPGRLMSLYIWYARFTFM